MPIKKKHEQTDETNGIVLLRACVVCFNNMWPRAYGHNRIIVYCLSQNNFFSRLHSFNVKRPLIIPRGRVQPTFSGHGRLPKSVCTIPPELAYKNRSYFARQSVSQGLWRKDFAVNLIHAQSVGDVVRMEFESLHLYTTAIKRCTNKQRVSPARPVLSLRWHTQWTESVRGTWSFPQDPGTHVYLKIIRKEKKKNKKRSEFVTIALRFTRGGTTGEYDRPADGPIIPYDKTGADMKKIIVFPATISFDKSSPGRGVYILFDALVRGESLRNCYISRRVPTHMTRKVGISMYFCSKLRALGENTNIYNDRIWDV